jgi:hypothetical protein
MHLYSPTCFICYILARKTSKRKEKSNLRKDLSLSRSKTSNVCVVSIYTSHVACRLLLIAVSSCSYLYTHILYLNVKAIDRTQSFYNVGVIYGGQKSIITGHSVSYIYSSTAA